MEDMREIKDMIVDAKIVKKETMEHEIYKKEMSKQITRINSSIQRAKEKGLVNTCFCGYGAYETDLKMMYRSKGYYFKPTGYIGGDWQLSEEICW